MNPTAPSGRLDPRHKPRSRIKQAAPVGRRIKQATPAGGLTIQAPPVGRRIKQAPHPDRIIHQVVPTYRPINQALPAGRRAKITHRRWYFRSSTAAFGGLALFIAGIGSVSISGQEGMNLLNGDYQALERPLSLASSKNVSRDFDRAPLTELIEAQADQLARNQQKLQSIAAEEAKAKAEELKATQWVLPVKDYRISGRYGATNSIWGHGHSGLDFAGPSGSTIVSIAAGTVISAGYSGNCGNMTEIQLDDEDLVVKYCHQSRIAVESGQRVQAGETIGYTGSTGRSTGPHLHLEIKPVGGQSVDPEPFFRENNLRP